MKHSRFSHGLLNKAGRVIVNEPPHFLIIPKIKHPLNDIASVFFRVNRLGVHVPKKRGAKFNRLFGSFRNLSHGSIVANFGTKEKSSRSPYDTMFKPLNICSIP